MPSLLSLLILVGKGHLNVTVVAVVEDDVDDVAVVDAASGVVEDDLLDVNVEIRHLIRAFSDVASSS